MGVDLKACVPHADMDQGGGVRFTPLLEIGEFIESDHGWAPMLRLRALILASFALMYIPITALPVKAAGSPDAAKGLVAEHCSECHAVPGYSSQGLPTVEAPSFQAIADAPDTYTEQRLRTFLVQPHWPMEQFCMTPSDIDNIVAYVKSFGSE